MQTNFADTILTINLTSSLVRIELGTISPVPGKEGQDGKQDLRATPTQQLVMPLEGFLRAFALQEKLVKKLIADRVLKAEPQSEAPTAGAVTGSSTRQ